MMKKSQKKKTANQAQDLNHQSNAGFTTAEGGGQKKDDRREKGVFPSNEGLTDDSVKRTTVGKNDVFPSNSNSEEPQKKGKGQKKSEKEAKKGKRNRAAGARFELKVRNDLKSKGWIVDKWMNNIDFEKDEIAPAKRKYNPYLKALSIGNGFPDFVAFKRLPQNPEKFNVIGVEVKRRGYLDKEERKRSRWYVKNKIFSEFWIAKEARNKNDKRKTEIEYINFEDKYEIN